MPCASFVGQLVLPSACAAEAGGHQRKAFGALSGAEWAGAPFLRTAPQGRSPAAAGGDLAARACLTRWKIMEALLRFCLGALKALLRPCEGLIKALKCI